MVADVLIVGQGVTGSILAQHLLKRKKTVCIVDPVRDRLPDKIINKALSPAKKSNRFLSTASAFYPAFKSLFAGSIGVSRVIGGLITPITGKRLLKTWMCDDFLPYAHHFYRNLEVILQASFFKPLPIVRIFASAEQANEWSVKSVSDEYKPYIFDNYTFGNPRLNMAHGFTVFDKGAVVNGSLMLEKYHDFLHQRQSLISEKLVYDDLRIETDSVRWKDVTAKKIVFCEGWHALSNPFFKHLPFQPSKGELLVIKSKKLKLKEIINRGIFIRPLIEDFYLVGSTYTWDDLTLKPTAEARNELSGKLEGLLNVPFKIIDHFAGIRPTVKNRRPFMGAHPEYKNIYIFNGLGTKGLLLAPYLSNHFCEYLYEGKGLLAEVDVKRFVFFR